MFSKIVLVCLFAAAVLAQQQDQKQQQQQQLDNDYTEKVQQSQPFWQQYRPVIDFTRDSEGIQKVIRVPGNPYFQGIKVNVRPYGGYVAIRTNGAEIIKPLTPNVDPTDQDQEIIIETQTTADDQQQQLLQQQREREQQQLYQDYPEYRRSARYVYPQQQYNNYLVRYPLWSRFLQQYQPQYQQQQQLYYQQENIPQYYNREQYLRPYGQQYEDIYTQQQQGEYDRVVRDTSYKKDKKSRGDKQQEQQDKLIEQQQQGLYYPYRVPLEYQPYQRVPYQIFGRNIYEQQQQMPYYRGYGLENQQGPYNYPLLNRLLGYQQGYYPYYQQQQQQYQPYNIPVYGF